MKQNFSATVLLVGLCLLPACSRQQDIHGYYSVEIAPGKFVPVKFSKWFPRRMSIQYSNTVVKYEGYIELNAPQTLMEFDGKLYLLALHAGRKRPRNEWLYRCFRQEGNGFKEIPAEDFPRSIAIFNLWRPGDPRRYSRGMDGETIDAAREARELNPDDKYFLNSYQARLWYMLEVTNNLYKAEWEYSVAESTNFVSQYIAKYKPVHLTSMEMKPLPKSKYKF